MKVVMVTETFLPRNIGGTEIYVLNLCRALQEQGIRVAVLIPGEENRSTGEHCGIPCFEFRSPRKFSPRYMNGLKIAPAVSDFMLMLKRIDGDVVHFHSLGSSVNGYYLKAVAEIRKVVFTPHLAGTFCLNGDLQDTEKRICSGKVETRRCLSCFIRRHYPGFAFPRTAAAILNAATGIPGLRQLLPPALSVGRWRKRELEMVADSADTIVAIADWIYALLKKNRIENVTLVRQGVVPGPSRLRDTRAPGPVRLLFVGRIYELKNLDVLLDVLESLPPDDFEFQIAAIKSDTEYFRSVKNRVRKLKRHQWRENMAREELGELMAQADYLLLPSRSEMAPLVILEAFQSSLPVIGSDIPAIREWVTPEKDGLLFPAGDREALGKLLRKVCAAPELSVSLAKRIAPPRTFREIAAEMIEIYTGSPGRSGAGFARSALPDEK